MRTSATRRAWQAQERFLKAATREGLKSATIRFALRPNKLARLLLRYFRLYFRPCGAETSRFSCHARGTQGGAQDRPLWLSVVVLEELLVGARTGRMKKLLSHLERDFEARGKTPHSPPVGLGQRQVREIVGERQRLRKKVGRARMTNDALIAHERG